MPITRPLTIDDAESLLRLLVANQQFLAPYQPTMRPGDLTLGGQRELIAKLLHDHELGRGMPRLILDGDQIVGRVTLSNIVRGAFQSCNVGYWVSEAANGRGLASAAVAEVTALAFTELGLHRVEAGTLTNNVASQRVLERNGFRRFGMAEGYLQIAGRWQDHILFQKLAPSESAVALSDRCQ